MFEDLQSAMANAKLLGVLVTWDLHTSGTLLTRSALRDAAEEHDVPLEIDEPRPEGVFRKIVSSVRTIHKPLISRIIHEDDGVIVWAIVDTSLEGDERVGDEVGRMVNRVAFRRVSVDGQPLFTFEVDDEVATAVTDRFDYQLNYLGNDDVRLAIGNTLRQWGSIRLHGRMFFLGRSKVEQVQHMQAALQQVGTRFWLIPIPDLMDSTSSIAHHAHERFSQELKDLRVEVDRWLAGERAPRTATLKARLKVFEKLGEEIGTMTEAMQMDADDLLDEIAGLRKGVKRLLSPKASKPAEDDPSPADTEEKQDEEETTEEDRPPASSGPPSRPQPPKSRALGELSLAELRVQARNLDIDPVPNSKKKLIAAIREVAERRA